MDSLCHNCAYIGDKYSFPLPNDHQDTYEDNPLKKHYYCCCGDTELYEKEVTELCVSKCDSFEPI